MRTPLGYHVDHLLSGMDSAEHPYGLVGRVEGWLLGAVWIHVGNNISEK
jgi:hypothetical protein